MRLVSTYSIVSGNDCVLKGIPRDFKILRGIPSVSPLRMLPGKNASGKLSTFDSDQLGELFGVFGFNCSNYSSWLFFNLGDKSFIMEQVVVNMQIQS